MAELHKGVTKEDVYYDIKELLGELIALKPEERSEEARRIQITITELEKLFAYYKTYVIGT